jgi:hypothetical protein
LQDYLETVVQGVLLDRETSLLGRRQGDDRLARTYSCMPLRSRKDVSTTKAGR